MSVDRVKTTMVPLRAGTGKKPVFLLHPLHGTTICFGPLAVLLGNKHPLYAFQSQGFLEGGKASRSVSEMAEHYLEQILDVDEDGPYFLVGYSLGAYIAVEIAIRLRQLGKEIAQIISIDNSLDYKFDVEWDYDFISLLLLFQEKFTNELLEEFKSIKKEDQPEYLLDMAYRGKRFPATLEREYAKQLIDVHIAHTYANVEYVKMLRNKREYIRALPITFFMGTERPPFVTFDISTFDAIDENHNHIINYVQGAHHFTILTMPFVKDLASKMAVTLQHAHERYGLSE